MAAKSGISRATIQTIENRTHSHPSPATLTRIAKAFIESAAFDEMTMRSLLLDLGVPFTILSDVVGRVLASHTTIEAARPPPLEDPDASLISMLRKAINIHGRARMQAVLAGMLVPGVDTTSVPPPTQPPQKSNQARARRAG